MTAALTKQEINLLCTMLRDSAQAKKRRAKEVHENDRQDMLDSAMRDYELRKKLIAMKVETHPYEDVLQRMNSMISHDVRLYVAGEGTMERLAAFRDSVKDFATFLENYLETQKGKS